MLTRFERHGQRPLPFRRFMLRMAIFALIALILDAALIAVGTIGFHALEHLGWLQAALNAGLVITGNGPMHPAVSGASAVFELLFAVAGDLAFLVIASVILAPVVHRILHTYHLAPDATPVPPPRTP